MMSHLRKALSSLRGVCCTYLAMIPWIIIGSAVSTSYNDFSSKGRSCSTIILICWVIIGLHSYNIWPNYYHCQNYHISIIFFNPWIAKSWLSQLKTLQIKSTHQRSSQDLFFFFLWRNACMIEASSYNIFIYYNLLNIMIVKPFRCVCVHKSYQPNDYNNIYKII